MTSTFIWADLSTFDIQAAKQFYSQSFGWNHQELGESYVLCSTDKHPAAGLYTMPEKFQRIGMPSFWMSYIHVQDIQQIVRAAEEHGAKVEIKPQAAPGGGQIALIRDPAGAGFTCYEGDNLGGRDSAGNFGRMVWNELHVSDLSRVESFYTHVFGWAVRATNDADRYEIYASSSAPKPIAGIQVTSNEIKGDKEYWGVYFSVSNLSTASKLIEQSGGKIVAEQPLGSLPAVLAYDPQGAAFYVVEGKRDSDVNHKVIATPTTKWRAISGLAVVAAAILIEVNWIWGLLFLLWVIPDIRRGSTHFLEHVERRKNPVVYWLIISTWVALSVYLMLGWAFGT